MSSFEVAYSDGQDPFPADLAEGETITVTFTAKVYGIERDLIDVTPLGGPETHIDGQRTIKLVASGSSTIKRST